MTDLSVGDTLRIPFLLYDSAGALAVDTTAANYTWPLVKDGTAVVSPAFTIANPTGSGLELVYAPATAGNYTFSSFTHSTNTPDLVEGGFLVRAYSVDDLMAALALPTAAPVGTVAEIGDKVRAFRNADWSQQFHLTNSDDTDLNLTGSTLLFRIGYRTSTSDTKLFTTTTLTPDSPATGGLVTVTMTATETGALPVSADLWYELEQTIVATSKKYVKGLGPFELIRDIPATP